MQTIWQGLRYGVRMLEKQPGFTLIAVLLLAPGTGVNTMIFNVSYALVLNPLRVVSVQFDDLTDSPDLALMEERAFHFR